MMRLESHSTVAYIAGDYSLSNFSGVSLCVCVCVCTQEFELTHQAIVI